MKKANFRFAIILIASVAIANPVVLYVLSKSILVASLGLVAVFFTLFIITSSMKKSQWITAYTVNILVILSLCLHFEAVFRYFFAEYVIQDLYTPRQHYFFNRANLNTFLEDAEYRTFYKTNKQGFRIGHACATSVEVGKCDWLFLGDSYAQGAQVSFEELFSSQLYRYYPNKIIVNAGISGFGMPEAYYLLKDISQKLEPQKVFVMISNFNDFMNVEKRSTSFSNYLMYYSDFARFLLFNLKFRKTNDLPLKRWTEPFYPSEKDNIDYNIFYKKTSSRKEKDIAAFKQYLTLLNQEVRKIGAELILIIVPTKEQTYYKYLEEVVSRFNIDLENLDMNYPNQIIHETAKQLGASCIDLTEEFSNRSQVVFFDRDEHLNSYGHSVAAYVLARWIKENNAVSDSNIIYQSRNLYGDRYPSYVGENRILFQGLDGEHYQIMVADLKRNTVEKLSCGQTDKTHPSLYKQLLVFTEGEQSSHQTKVVLMQENGSSRRLITKNQTQFGAIPSFSSDGRYVVYARWFLDEKSNNFTIPQIAYYDLTVDRETIITNSNYENWRPVFSSDLDSIVYISYYDKNFDIFKYSFKTRETVRLTNTPYDEWDPRISPDGSKIVYAARKNGNWDLFQMNIDGKNAKQLTFTKGDEWDPNYSKDGTKIIYAGEFGFMGGICEMPLNGKRNKGFR